MLRCEVQAHNSTALEINLHVGPVIFHMVRYARYFDRKRRFSADTAPAKSISRARIGAPENAGDSAQISPQGDPIAAGVEAPLRRPGEKFRFGGFRSFLKRPGPARKEKGQTRQYKKIKNHVAGMSALPPKADIQIMIPGQAPANVRFAPNSGHKWVGRWMSAYDPKRTLAVAPKGER